MVDFICLGDVTQDNFFFISDASVHCGLNNRDCQLLLRYGEKIPVEKYAALVGGNAANVAVGLARLGIKTKLITAFGDDNRGALIKRDLLRQGVDLEDSVTEPGRESNLSGIIVFRGERTILSHHVDRPDPDFKLPPARFIYLTSSTGRSSASLYEKLLAYKLADPVAQIAFNPSVADLARNEKNFFDVIQNTDYFILNWEEAEVLLKESFPKTPNARNGNAKKILQSLHALGPKIVAVTDGAHGSFGFSADHFHFMPPSPDQPFETTGAGDAFSGGLLGALLKNPEDIKTALVWGATNSGSVITKIGAQAGLLTPLDIQKYLVDHPDFKPSEI